MKILKVELQNINSLRCDKPIVIDFESNQFKDVGLFAITGATGAGKTTILDAITIALYRKVPRFINSNSKAGLLDVVSYGASDAMCRVTFETKKERFESQWEVRLTSGSGKILTNPRENVYLKNLSSGTILAESKNKCEVEIERITQLSYEQFLRSVLLAQGEFAAFLSAPAKEKGNLLQQITGEDIYRKFGEALSQRISDEKVDLERIKHKINTDDLLPEETIDQFRKEEEEHAFIIQQLNTELASIEITLNWFAKKDELIKKQNLLEKEKSDFELKLEGNRDVLKRLSKHEAAEPFKEILDEISRSEKEITKKNERLEKIESELKGIGVELIKTEEKEKTTKSLVDESEREFKEWQPRLDEVTRLDQEMRGVTKAAGEKKKDVTVYETAIHQLTASLKEQVEVQKQNQVKLLVTEKYLAENIRIPEIEKNVSQWNTFLTLRKSNREQLMKLNHEINMIQSEQAVTQSDIARTRTLYQVEKNSIVQLTGNIKEIADQLTRKNLDDLLAKNKTLEAKKTDWRELQLLSVNFNKSVKIDAELNAEKLVLEKTREEIRKEIETSETDIIIADESLKDAQQIYELENKISSFEEERKKLERGKPCNLCGSTVHPYVEHYKYPELSKSKKTVEERSLKLEKLKSIKQKSDIALAENNIKLEDCSKKINLNHHVIEETQNRFDAYLSVFNILDTITLNDTLLLVENELKLVSDDILETQKRLKQKDEIELKLNQTREKAKTLEVQLAAFIEKIKVFDVTLNQKDKDLKKLSAATINMESGLSAQLSVYRIKLPEVESTSSFLKELEESINLFNDSKKKLVDIQHFLQQLKADMDNIEHQLKEKNEHKQRLEDEIKQHKTIYLQFLEKRAIILPIESTPENKRTSLQNKLEIARKDRENITNELNRLQNEKSILASEKETIGKDQLENGLQIDTAKTLLNVKLKMSEFLTREELMMALLSDEEKKNFSEIKKQLDQKTIEIKTLSAVIHADLEKLESEHSFDGTEEQMRNQKAGMNAKKEFSQNRLAEIKSKFLLDTEIRDRNKSVVAELNLQEEVLKKWQGLMILLGGSKDAFNTYVQRLTLNNLINLANLHLYKLNRRYSLELNKTYLKGEELNFMLLDHYQTDETRLVDTSSGGEKFLISLSLALGLSDLASHNVSIGSLFIDEGFGSLDSNTLETVISTLETLQAQGKMIGIISHVDNLKERIPVQIQVLKKSNGVSIVEIN